MATIKSFTSVEQSKVLSKILPLDSADMYWDYDVQKHEHYLMVMDDQFDDTCIRAWSLAALYNILPNSEYITTTLSRGAWKLKTREFIDKWYCEYEDENDPWNATTISASNPVDACVEMVIKLHELNLL